MENKNLSKTIAVGIISAVAVGLLVASNMMIASVFFLVILSILFFSLSLNLQIQILLFLVLVIPEFGMPLTDYFKIPGTPFLIYIPLMIVIIFKWLLFKLSRMKHTTIGELGSYSNPLSAFFLMITVGFFIGLAQNEFRFILSDVHGLFPIFLILIFTDVFSRVREEELALIMHRVLIFGIMGAALQILLYFLEPSLVVSVMTPGRLVSRNDSIYNFILIVLPVIISYKANFSKIYFAGAIILCIKLALSLTRATIPVFMFYYALVLAYWMFHDKGIFTKRPRRLIYTIMKVMIFMGLLVGAISILNPILVTTTFDHFALRFSELFLVDNATDIFFVQTTRIFIDQSLNAWRNSPIFGAGLGSTFIFYLPQWAVDASGIIAMENVFMDNLIFTFLLKFGIAGIIILVVIYYKILKNAMYILRKSKHIENVNIRAYLVAFSLYSIVLCLEALISAQFFYFKVSIVLYLFISVTDIYVVRIRNKIKSVVKNFSPN